MLIVFLNDNEAVRCYNLAKKSNSDSANAYYNKAIALVKLNKSNDAIQCKTWQKN